MRSIICKRMCYCFSLSLIIISLTTLTSIRTVVLNSMQTLNLDLEEEQGFRESILELLDSYTTEKPNPVIQHMEQTLFF